MDIFAKRTLKATEFGWEIMYVFDLTKAPIGRYFIFEEITRRSLTL